jgi:anaerobic magnesium-protoporphyrin IX monomethyl ester cyclase
MRQTVLLYSPPPVLDKPSTRAPLALLAIAGPLQAAGYKVVILPRDPASHPAVFQALAGEIICYGVSVMTGPQIKQALASTRAFRSAVPGGRVVWGGWHPTIFPEQVARHPDIDVAVAGRGEDAFLNLVTCLSNKMSYGGVEGLVFAADGRMHNNGIARGKDINSYPALDYGLLQMDDYIFADDIASRTINYVSSRGCPKNCASCAQSLVSNGVWRSYAPARMIEDALRLKNDFGVNGLLFDDANFFVDEERARNFAAGLINRQASVAWGMPTGRLEDALRFDDTFWDIMKNSGLKSIFVGLEPRCGAISRTKTDIYGELDDAVSGLAQKLTRHSITLTLSVLVGFPPSGSYDWTFEQEIAGAATLIRDCLSGGARVRASISLYLPFPHAPLYDLALNNGLKPPGSLEEWAGWDPGAREMPWVPQGALETVNKMNQEFAKE